MATWQGQLWFIDSLLQVSAIRRLWMKERQTSLAPGPLLKNRGRRKPGNIHRRGCWFQAPGSSGTNQIAEQNHLYRWQLSTQQKIDLKMNLYAQTTLRRLVKNSFWMCGRDTVQRFRRGCRFVYRFTHRTSQLQVCMYKARDGTQQSCRCLEDKSEIVNSLALLPGTVVK